MREPGTIYYRKSDGRWVAAIEYPPKDGKRVRKTLTADSKMHAQILLEHLRTLHNFDVRHRG